MQKCRGHKKGNGATCVDGALTACNPRGLVVLYVTDIALWELYEDDTASHSGPYLYGFRD